MRYERAHVRRLKLISRRIQISSTRNLPLLFAANGNAIIGNRGAFNRDRGTKSSIRQLSRIQLVRKRHPDECPPFVQRSITEEYFSDFFQSNYDRPGRWFTTTSCDVSINLRHVCMWSFMVFMRDHEISETLISMSIPKLVSVRGHRGGVKWVARRVISKRKPVENIRTHDSGQTRNVER